MLKAIENKQYIIIYHTILALTLFTNEESFRSNKILSDSFSAITSTINIYTKFILGQSIENTILTSHKTIKLVWVPSHIGIPGIKFSDKLEMKVARSPDTKIYLHVTYEDVIYALKN